MWVSEKSNQAKKVQAVGDEYSEMQKNKRKWRCNLMNVKQTNKQTNKQNKHPLMQTVFFLLLCTTYNDLKQLCASTQAFDGTYT